MVVEFQGVAFEWRGPAPFLFVKTPPAVSDEIRAVVGQLSYGWGCIPVKGRIGQTSFTTSLIPKDGNYLVPIKLAIQRAERVQEGGEMSVRLEFELRQ